MGTSLVAPDIGRSTAKYPSGETGGLTQVGASPTERVAAARRFVIEVDALFQRHAAPNREAFDGGTGGRWGANFRVIYLGRPHDGVVIEAYRHLVEDAGVAPERVRPRTLYEVAVAVPNVLDIRSPEALRVLGLTIEDVCSPVGDYDRCQAVGAAAHQLSLKGILVTAAHQRGETLALFRNRLSVSELPRVERTSTWVQLPADPRRLRAVDSTERPRQG